MDWDIITPDGILSSAICVACCVAFILIFNAIIRFRTSHARKASKIQQLQAEDDAAIHARLMEFCTRGWFCWWCEFRQTGPRPADGFCSDLCADDYARYCEELAG